MNKIAIIGMGPRGCVLLERLISYIIIYNLNPNEFDILIFDARYIGGSLVYDVESDNILLNTISSQITLYSGETASEFGPIYRGPSLYEYYVSEYIEYETTPFTYLPRKVFLKYLQDFIQKQLLRLKSHDINYKIIEKEVINVFFNNENVNIITASQMFTVNKAILCTGHGACHMDNTNEFNHNILSVNNFNQELSNSKILIKGMGLVAFDVISELTQGLGGKFLEKNGELLYIPSGIEPEIFIYSRTGIPLLGRAKKIKVQTIYEPQYFTANNVNDIINRKMKIDFDNDILPLLIKELDYRFHQIEPHEKFNVNDLLHPEYKISKNSFKEFTQSFMNILLNDIYTCNLGVEKSGLKSSAEVIRDLRDNIRLAVENSKLTEQSHRRFLNYWHPIFNRICVGPPHFRIEQLKALINVGIVKLDVASNPSIKKDKNGFCGISNYGREIKEIFTKYFIDASIPTAHSVTTNSLLWNNLSSRIMRFTNGKYQPGGISIDENFKVFNNHGVTINNLYAFGIPTEGYKYFTYILPRPDVPSTFLKDSNLIAKSLLEII